MTTTTNYGTWGNRVSVYSTGPDAVITDAVGGGDPEWRERLRTTGAYAAMCTEYRAAINDALPPDVALCGNEFIGPAQPEDGEFDGYPVDQSGGLDIKAIVEKVDVSMIIECHDPDRTGQ